MRVVRVEFGVEVLDRRGVAGGPDNEAGDGCCDGDLPAAASMLASAASQSAAEGEPVTICSVG